jgi:hypothetical protein
MLVKDKPKTILDINKNQVSSLDTLSPMFTSVHDNLMYTSPNLKYLLMEVKLVPDQLSTLLLDHKNKQSVSPSPYSWICSAWSTHQPPDKAKAIYATECFLQYLLK